MPTETGPQPRRGLSLASHSQLRRHTRSLFVTLAASAMLSGAPAIFAAAPPAHPASAPPAQTAHPAAPIPPAPAQPKTPDWPANNPPRPATVVLNSHGLLIEANNSSLKQILNGVSAATGAEVEGLNSDERIFGTYGPGQVHDVLSQLLDGSGYNVMIIGDQSRTTPLRIVLSAPPKGGIAPAPDNSASSGNQDSSVEAPPPYQPQLPLIHTGSRPGAPPRTPQEIMQEMRQRQQEIRQREEQMREGKQQQN